METTTSGLVLSNSLTNSGVRSSSYMGLGKTELEDEEEDTTGRPSSLVVMTTATSGPSLFKGPPQLSRAKFVSFRLSNPVSGEDWEKGIGETGALVLVWHFRCGVIQKNLRFSQRLGFVAGAVPVLQLVSPQRRRGKKRETKWVARKGPRAPGSQTKRS
ncbi:hypothetical protein J0S82_004247 [Galemys pyrenaicus]|uniref:Uncharacterized protein n=1 Tax=Galemys pyrenaicus TaxID=202257 RepID=A0A8J5ZU03_GALPY|nr:hypothetical protein J0S82_004247 [Galemys pyrenaicus]